MNRRVFLGSSAAAILVGAAVNPLRADFKHLPSSNKMVVREVRQWMPSADNIVFRYDTAWWDGDGDQYQAHVMHYLKDDKLQTIEENAVFVRRMFKALLRDRQVVHFVRLPLPGGVVGRYLE